MTVSFLISSRIVGYISDEKLAIALVNMVMKMKVNMDDVEYITETALTIRGTRRRTTMPKVIVDKLGLMDGDKIRWILFKNGSIFITKVNR